MDRTLHKITNCNWCVFITTQLLYLFSSNIVMASSLDAKVICIDKKVDDSVKNKNVDRNNQFYRATIFLHYIAYIHKKLVWLNLGCNVNFLYKCKPLFFNTVQKSLVDEAYRKKMQYFYISFCKSFNAHTSMTDENITTVGSTDTRYRQ